MRVTQARAEDDALVLVGFGGESNHPIRRQDALGLDQRRSKIGDIDHSVGGQQEISAGIGLARKTRHHVGGLQFVVETGRTCLLQHAGGEINADEMVDLLGKGRGVSRTPNSHFGKFSYQSKRF